MMKVVENSIEEAKETAEETALTDIAVAMIAEEIKRAAEVGAARETVGEEFDMPEVATVELDDGVDARIVWTLELGTEVGEVMGVVSLELDDIALTPICALTINRRNWFQSVPSDW
jgi:hypothetical protein